MQAETERAVVEAASEAEGSEPYAQLRRVQLENGSAAYSEPRFIQGVFAFLGVGLDRPVPLDGTVYVVPPQRRTQPIYFRAGNSARELVCLLLTRNGHPFRYFPVGALASVHIPLAVVEDLLPGDELALHLAAPDGVGGSVVVDLGLLEG